MLNKQHQRLTIAEQKTADLHNFNRIGTDPDFDFNDIADNQGGSLQNGQLQIPAGEIIRQLTANQRQTFTLSWQVENGYWRQQQLSYQLPRPGDQIADQKRVTVTVSWQQQQQTAQLQLLTIIAALSPWATELLYPTIKPEDQPKPQLLFQPNQNPGSLALPMTDHSQRETSLTVHKDLPGTEIRSVLFDNNGKLLTQNRFITVACQCRFNGSGLTQTSAYGKWNTDLQRFEDVTGDLVDKTQGCVSDDNGQSCTVDQDSLCNRCCRDHHDPMNTTRDKQQQAYCDPAQGIIDRCYDPFRGSADFKQGQHRHYNAQGLAVDNGIYRESCRMKQINGSWQVYQDWQRLDLNLFTLDWLNSHHNTYQTYIHQLIDTLIHSPLTLFNAQNRPGDADPAIKWPDKQLLSQGNQPIALGSQQILSARGIYLDFLSTDAMNGLRQRQAAHQDYLSLLPLYEIELNQLAPYCAADNSGGWCSDMAQSLTVGAGNPDTPNGLSPGVIQAQAAANNSIQIHFGLRRSNSGLTMTGQAVDHSAVINSDHLVDQVQLGFTINNQPD